jgi:hypothetical protein
MFGMALASLRYSQMHTSLSVPGRPTRPISAELLAIPESRITTGSPARVCNLDMIMVLPDGRTVVPSLNSGHAQLLAVERKGSGNAGKHAGGNCAAYDRRGATLDCLCDRSSPPAEHRGGGYQKWQHIRQNRTR